MNQCSSGQKAASDGWFCLRSFATFPEGCLQDFLAVKFSLAKTTQNLAHAHHQDAVADTDQFLDLGGDEQDRRAFGGNIVDNGTLLSPKLAVEP